MHAKRHAQRSETQPKKGPIAMLQEFVQYSKAFPLPPHCAALHWTYDPRAASKSVLEYRAIVSFYLDGVPHHVAGGWQPSKKGAQRDTADRALSLFVGKWGAESMLSRSLRGTPSWQLVNENLDLVDKGYEERLLEDFYAQLQASGRRSDMKWNIQLVESNDENFDGYTTANCFAILELELMGVSHKLAGVAKATRKDAIADTARRALWYLQCPGFEHVFEPEKLVRVKGAAGKALEEVQEIPVPPFGWVCDDSSEEALEEAKRKTAVVRLQNRLQQQFARQMSPGQSVWEWSYIADPDDKQWPPLFQATVAIPALQKKFTGDWVRGQRDAKIDTIARVSRFLDEISCRVHEQPRGKGSRHRSDLSHFIGLSAAVSCAGS